MTNFRRFAFLTIVATYLVIFTGGLVRVSGAGLGCPDWPKCYGRWIPPVNAGQLPPDIDASTFNFTLAWIEYFNRLVGVVVGILILITAILAIRYHRRVKEIVIPSIAAAILVAYQGWQGSQVVSSKLEPMIVSLHTILALIIVSLLIYAAQRAYRLEQGEAVSIKAARKIRIESGILWGVAIFQVLFGTHVRSTMETLERNHPLSSDSDLVGMVGPTGYVHFLLGLLVIGFSFHIVRAMLKQSDELPVYIKQTIFGIAILMIAQLVLGFILVVVGMPELIRVFHLWVASLFLGLILVLYSAFRASMGENYAG